MNKRKFGQLSVRSCSSVPVPQLPLFTLERFHTGWYLENQTANTAISKELNFPDKRVSCSEVGSFVSKDLRLVSCKAVLMGNETFNQQRSKGKNRMYYSVWIMLN